MKMYNLLKIIVVSAFCVCSIAFAATQATAEGDDIFSAKKVASGVDLTASRVLSQKVRHNTMNDGSSRYIDDSSPEVHLPLSDSLKAFFSFGSDVPDTREDTYNDHYRALLGIDIDLR